MEYPLRLRAFHSFQYAVIVYQLDVCQFCRRQRHGHGVYKALYHCLQGLGREFRHAMYEITRGSQSSSKHWIHLVAVKDQLNDRKSWQPNLELVIQLNFGYYRRCQGHAVCVQWSI